jgi:anti-sigma B factor antagonist
MFSVDLSTREWDDHVVVALGGELDLVDAADVEAALATVAAREPEIIVDPAALEFTDSSGVAALARGRTHAPHAVGDLLLAAPQQPVLRVLAATGLVEDFSMHASVEEAAANARRSRRVVVPLQRPRRTRWPHTIVQSGMPSSGAEHGSPRQQTGEAGASPLPRSRSAEPMTVKDGPALRSAARNIARLDPATVVPFPGPGDDR